MNVSTFEDKDISIQKHESQQNRTQMKNQKKRHTKKIQNNKLHELEF